MKKKNISLLIALILVLQTLAMPIMAGAATKYLIQSSDFSELAAAPDLPLRINGDPWLSKGSAATQEFVLKEENGKTFGHFTSDSVKDGKAGEGSWYLYYRVQKSPIVDNGFAKFNIRVNQGPIQFKIGAYTDPTKGSDPRAVNIYFDTDAKTVTAASANGKKNEITSKFQAGEWYTLLVEVDQTNQEYTVSLTDKDGKVSKAEGLSYEDPKAEGLFIYSFEYVRKFNGHDFDLSDVTIALGKYDPNAPVATPTPAPTATPEATTTPTVAPTESPRPVKFTDIPSDHWAKDTITKMYQSKIIDGLSETEFAPDKEIKRAEFIKLVVASLGLDTKATYSGAITDVSTHWSATFVQAAETAGLIDSNLIVDGKLLPEQNITREEMASLITLAAKAKNIDIAGGSVDNFADKGDIADWATSYVASAVKLEIVKGMTDTTFEPKTLANRAQAAVMLNRLLEQIK